MPDFDAIQELSAKADASGLRWQELNDQARAAKREHEADLDRLQDAIRGYQLPPTSFNPTASDITPPLPRG